MSGAIKVEPHDAEGRPRRHTDQGEERKQQLLDAAAELFSTRGFGPTRIIDICEHAGVAKGLFYWYFDTKESLFAELLRSMRQRLRRAQGDAMDPAADAVTRMRQGAIATMRFVRENRAYFTLLDIGSTEQAEAVQEGRRIYIRDIERLVVEAQADGLIDPSFDPRLVAIGVVSAIGAFSEHVRSGAEPNDPDASAEFAADWVVRAVGAG